MVWSDCKIKYPNFIIVDVRVPNLVFSTCVVVWGWRKKTDVLQQKNKWELPLMNFVSKGCSWNSQKTIYVVFNAFKLCFKLSFKKNILKNVPVTFCFITLIRSSSIQKSKVSKLWILALVSDCFIEKLYSSKYFFVNIAHIPSIFCLICMSPLNLSYCSGGFKRLKINTP